MERLDEAIVGSEVADQTMLRPATVVQDIDKTVPVQHISPRNSFGYQGQLTYPQVPHGWRVRFIDETNGYKNNERIVYDDGYSKANASKLMGIEFPGVTDPELIWRHARRRIAEARLRPETHKVSVDIEGLVATRGDLVRFSHDAVKVGLGHGRLKPPQQDAAYEDREECLHEFASILHQSMRSMMTSSMYRSLILVWRRAVPTMEKPCFR